MDLPRIATAILSATLLLSFVMAGVGSKDRVTAQTSARFPDGTRGSPLSKLPLITEVYYDTLVANEYITLSNEAENDIDISGWKMTDLEGTLGFPSGAVLPARGRIVVTQNSTLYRRDTLQVADFSIDGVLSPAMVRIGGSFQLKNEGDEVLLKDPVGLLVDAFAFGASRYDGSGWSGPPAPVVHKGHVALRENSGGNFLDTNSSMDWDGLRAPIIGQSSHSPPSFEFDGIAQVVVSPVGALHVLSEIVDSARDSLYMNLYEFTSDALSLDVIAAIERGVDVRVLVEGAPVGGIREAELSILKRLEMAGADVHLMMDNSADGVRARYRYDHAKYLVFDNETVFVGSENWGETAFPIQDTSGNRGWSIRLDDVDLAAYLAGVFLEDWDPARRDIVELKDATIAAVPGDEDEAVGRPAAFPFEPFRGHFNVTLLVGPDNSLDESTVTGLIRSANTSLHIEEFYISPSWENRTNLYLDEAIRAARRGVDVKILLDSSWYNVDQNDTMDNDDVVRILEDIARTEGIRLAAKLANAASHGLTKFHNKGIVVDRRKALISSLNWNLNSATENREVGLIVENSQIAGFLDNVFEHDWKDDVTPPVADAGQDLEVFAGDEFLLASTGSRDDIGIVAYHWDLGSDGSFEANESVVTWCFDNPGTYRITLIVEDAWGNLANDSIVVQVVVRPSPPTEDNLEIPWWAVIILAILAMAIVVAFTKSRRK